jgi:WYL domain
MFLIFIIVIVVIVIIFLYLKNKKNTMTSEIFETTDEPFLLNNQSVEKRNYNKTDVQFDKLVEIKLSKNLEVDVQHNSVDAKFKFERLFYDASKRQFVIKAYNYLDTDHNWSGRISTLYSDKLNNIFYNGDYYEDIYELLKEIEPDNEFFHKKSLQNIKSKISFEYLNSDGARSNRTVDVEDIYLSNGSYYIKGYCNLRNENRTFRVDNMSNIVDLTSGEEFKTHNEYLEKIKN